MGLAGRARERALSQISEIQLMGVISRRPGIGNLSWEEALQNSEINALAISTENTDHTRCVREALQADKHVLCDYPLALSAQEAQSLLDLEHFQKKILHVEHLGLLTETFLTAKKDIQKLCPLVEGHYRFQGGWDTSLADTSRTGPYPILAYAPLMQIADFFGSFQIQDFAKKINSSGFSLKLKLHFENGGTLIFEEERREGLERTRSLQAKFRNDSYEWTPTRETAGLFAQDLRHFQQRVQNNVEPYYQTEKMILILRELEKIFR